MSDFIDLTLSEEEGQGPPKRQRSATGFWARLSGIVRSSGAAENDEVQIVEQQGEPPMGSQAAQLGDDEDLVVLGERGGVSWWMREPGKCVWACQETYGAASLWAAL